MTYEAVVADIYQRLPLFSKDGAKAMNYKLQKVQNFISHLHLKLNQNYIHVAGSNGKGSTCHLLAHMLQNDGCKVALFSSPHLVDFRERIKIGKTLIPKDLVLAFYEENLDFIDQEEVSFFEFTTALALWYFEKHQDLDYVILETGLGGRLDATNIIPQSTSLITSISLEHTDILGDTLEAIAMEKSGIIKKQSNVFISSAIPEVAQKVIKDYALTQEAQLFYEDVDFKMDASLDFPDYLIQNSQLAHQAFKTLRNKKLKAEGLENFKRQTLFKGRMDLIHKGNQKYLVDAFHNPESWNAFWQHFQQFETPENWTVVLGFSKDKDYLPIMETIAQQFKSAYFYDISGPRGLKYDELPSHLKSFFTTFDSFKKLSSLPHESILIGGSLYMLGDFYAVIDL